MPVYLPWSSTPVLPLNLLLTRVFIGDQWLEFCVRIQCSSCCLRRSFSILSFSRCMDSSRRAISDRGDLPLLLLWCLFIIALFSDYVLRAVMLRRRMVSPSSCQRS